MAISDALENTLNKMCISAKNALLGTIIQTAQTDIATLQGAVKYGVYTVTAADVTATKSIIPAGKTITGQIVSIIRSNLQLSGAKVTFATTNLTIETNSTVYVLTAGDIVNYIVF